MSRKTKKNRINVILISIVVVLAVVVGTLSGLLYYMKDSYDSTQEELKVLRQEMESLRQDAETEDAAETGTEQESEQESESKAAETVTDTQKETVDAAETESESEAAAETESETETETEAPKLTVAIDPGHQGNWIDMSATEPNAPGSSVMKAKATTGTQGRFSGLTEFELNLQVSLQLRDELESRGYRVILTRDTNDAAISNAERAQMAAEQGGDIYVRIHANGSDNSGVQGALAMVPSASNPYVGNLAEDSYKLGNCILQEYCNKAGFQSQGIQYHDDMTGINWSTLPVMILEMGYMTNEYDDLRMADPNAQVLMVQGIADGIDRYFEEKGMKEKEPVVVTPEAQAKMDGLIEKIEESYVGPSGDAGETWAVSIKNLASGAEGSINGDMPLKSASIIKVFIMATAYDRVCYPSSEDRRLKVENYDGELRNLINAMITVSDNDASNTILERLGGGDAKAGMEVVNQFCRENGYTATSIGRRFLESNPTGDNFTSVNDCMRLLESIKNGTCVNKEASEKMYEFLKQQQRRFKIPAGINSSTAIIGNKTGELYGEYGDFVENDIAIVEDGNICYVLCVMSANLRDNGTGMSQITNISSTVYQSMSLVP